MPHALLILHFLGLMLGVSGAMGATVMLANARPAQKQKGGAVRGVGPLFTRISIFGLVLLWPSGIALLVMNDGAGLASAMFWMKTGFVVLLTVTTIGTEMVYTRARRRDPQLARLLPSLGPLAIICWVLAVVFAVLAFG